MKNNNVNEVRDFLTHCGMVFYWKPGGNWFPSGPVENYIRHDIQIQTSTRKYI